MPPIKSCPIKPGAGAPRVGGPPRPSAPPEASARAAAQTGFEPSVRAPTELRPADPVAADRAQARHELMPRFAIVPDGASADRRPNEVTRAELEAVVELYSDIRRGATSLRIDTEREGVPEPYGLGRYRPLPPRLAAFFRAKALDDIAAILQTPSGRKLLTELARAEHPVRVVLSGNERPEMSPTTTAPMVAGAATVYYLPGVSGARADWSDAPQAFSEPWQRNEPSHVVLYHELAHALAGVTGGRAEGWVVAADGVPEDAGRVPLEEHRANGLGRFAELPISENRYRAERRRIGEGTIGALPGDAGMPRQTSYLGAPPTGPTRPVEKDPVYIEMLVLSQLGEAGPPAAVEMAWTQRNDFQVPDALFLAAVERLVSPEYASTLGEKLALDRDELRDEYLAHRLARRQQAG